MITLSNGHRLEYVVASGALAYDGKGWIWERILVWLGFVKPQLFTVVTKSLTRHPRKGNLSWCKPWTWLPFSPWSCVRFVPGGSVNKVGLTNPGVEWWVAKIAPRLGFSGTPIIVSLFGSKDELVEMTKMINRFSIVGIEVNVSCPNVDHTSETMMIVEALKAVKEVSDHPVLVKLAVNQDFIAIERSLRGYAEAISFNSVPWNLVFPDKKSPLWQLEKRVGGGGGGVSGKPAQRLNWGAVGKLAKEGVIPVIAPSIMNKDDITIVRGLGAQAISFGAIHLQEPWKPTAIVERVKSEAISKLLLKKS